MTNRARVDPELLKQLETAASESRPIEAVVLLRIENRKHQRATKSTRAKTGSPNGAGSSDSFEAVVKDVMRRAEARSGSHVKDFNVFGHMGSFVVVAEPAFLKALMKEPEVESIVANRQRAPIDVLKHGRKS